jgi:hypothetical protein
MKLSERDQADLKPFAYDEWMLRATAAKLTHPQNRLRMRESQRRWRGGHGGQGGRDVEASLACSVLNRMTALGRSESRAISR